MNTTLLVMFSFFNGAGPVAAAAVPRIINLTGSTEPNRNLTGGTTQTQNLSGSV